MPPEAITSHSNELFKNEDFIHLITSELLRHSKNAKLYECPTIWMPVMVPFSPVSILLSLSRIVILTLSIAGESIDDSKAFIT